MGERLDSDDNDDEYGFDRPDARMSFPVFTDRLPRQSAAFDGLLTSRASVDAATTTQGGRAGSTPSSETGDGDEDGDGSTYTTPLRLTPTAVELSDSQTSMFTTPNRASVVSEATQATEAPEAATTLSTATSSEGSADSSADQSPASLVSGTTSPSANNTAFSELSAAAASRHGMSNGEIAAAVIMPILAAIAIFAALFFCRRRRRRQNSPPPPFFPAIREKMNHFRPRATSPSTISDPTTPVAAAAPIVTNRSNNAYYTGLDTSSQNSHSERRSASQEYYAPRRSEGGTFTDPPPPYHDSKPPPQLPAMDLSSEGGGVSFAGIPQLREPEPAVRTRSPFEDPISPLQEHERHAFGNEDSLSPIEPATAAMMNRSNPSIVSRAPSFSSTQYSETASVHSARAARMSVGGPQMVMSSSPSTQRSPTSPTDTAREGMATPTPAGRRGGEGAGVFDDPASPISSIASLEFHTLPGSRRGSGVSQLGEAANGRGHER